MKKKLITGLWITTLVIALSSGVWAQSWPNFHNGNTLIKGKLNVTDEVILNGALSYGTDTVTMSSADPGVGSIDVSGSSAVSYYVITDATGSSADELSISDGITAGQQLRVTLSVDGETSGLKIIPDSKLVGTNTLLEDAGDVITYEWTGSAWHVVSNIGGTEG